MKTLLITNILTMALVGTISQYALASDNHFSAPIKDEAFESGEARRMAALISGQSIAEAPAAAAETTNESIAEHVRLGVLTDVKGVKAVKQTYSKAAHATGTVEQGNISGSSIGGGVTQKFIGTVDAKKVEQGNISGTAIEGDIDQEF